MSSGMVRKIPAWRRLCHAGAMAALLARARAADTVRFTITDGTDPREWSEDTQIFINGEMIAHFRLDAAHPIERIDATVPRAPVYEYALCGRITILRPDGQREIHIVDGGGKLAAVDGRTFQALAAADFTVFYLAEETGRRPPDLHKTALCSEPIT